MRNEEKQSKLTENAKFNGASKFRLVVVVIRNLALENARVGHSHVLDLECEDAVAVAVKGLETLVGRVANLAHGHNGQIARADPRHLFREKKEKRFFN